jgi:hypothetical protein
MLFQSMVPPIEVKAIFLPVVKVRSDASWRSRLVRVLVRALIGWMSLISCRRGRGPRAAGTGRIRRPR